MNTRRRLLIIWAILCTATLGFAFSAQALSSPFKDYGATVKSLGFAQYSTTEGVKTVKIAILDNGFHDYKDQLGKTIPSDTVYHEGPVAVDPKDEESHGLFMAQMIAGAMKYAPMIKYELHLYSAYGYSNLESSVNDIVANKFDVVLYAQVWEYGGFGDGHGFINTLVDRATRAGILWVNAAGNFALGTYRGAIDTGSDDWVKLPAANNAVRIRCEKPAKKSGDKEKANKCRLRAVLSWNDFNDDMKIGTDKDLDLIVTDDTLKIVASSALQQVKQMPEKDAPPGTSLYPREFVKTELEPGTYLLRVKDRSRNFDADIDKLRLTVSGEGITMVDRTKGETILPPADNPRVITVGANDSERSSDSQTSRKPDLYAPSKVTLLNGDQYMGSSNASALTAAAVAILRGVHGEELNRKKAIKMLGTGAETQQGDSGQGLPLEMLRFAPTGRNCFRKARIQNMTQQLRQDLKPFLQNGGVIVDSTMGKKIFTTRDPFQFLDILRVAPDDMLVASPDGFQTLPRPNQEYLPEGFYEIVQFPQGQALCRSSESNENDDKTDNSQASNGKTIRLPAPSSEDDSTDN